MRKPVKILLIAFSGLFLLCGIGVGWVWWELRPRPLDSALPPIARDLPEKFVDGDRAFQDRVRLRFRPGIREAELRTALVSEGFKVRGQGARFQQSKFPCLLEWEISWRADPHQRVISVESSYGAVGCL